MWGRADKCCFCINQRLGVAIIACLLLVRDAFLLSCTSYLVYSSYADQEYAWEDGALRVAGASSTMRVSAALLSLAVLLDIVLLAAAISVRQKLLHGWLVTYAAVYILSLLTFWMNWDVFFTDYSGFFFMGLPAVLVVYFWIEVHSYYLQLRQKCEDGGHRPTGSKANWLVPTGGTLPAQWNLFSTPIKGTVPTTPPHYASSEKQALCHSDNDAKAPGGIS